MSQTNQDRDYYEILGADEEATRHEIERLYKRKAVEHHPDRGGSEEEMKTLNEAYGVLKDETQRRAYDAARQPAPSYIRSSVNYGEPPRRTSPAAKLDAITHQLGAAIMFLVLGLVLLFIVRFQYVIFLWPLALLAFFMIVVGVVQAHAVMGAIRQTTAARRPARRYVLMQEAAFWSIVCGGGYGVYLLLTAV